MARLIITDDENTRTRDLSNRQMEILAHALDVSANRFEEDAKSFGDIIAEYDRKGESGIEDEPKRNEEGAIVIKVPIITRQGAVQMKEQFERQARDARELWNLLEGGFDEEGEEPGRASSCR